MNPNFVHIDGFKKTFKGSIGKKPQAAVRNITFSVAEGEI